MVTILRDKPRTIKSYASENVVQVRAAIIKVITDGVLTLAQYKQPAPELVGLFVDAILKDYGQLSLDDLTLLMENGLKGRYGVKKTERDNIISFDMEVMLRWLEKYSEEKLEVARSYNPNPKQFPRDPKKPCKMPEHIRELLKKDIGYVNMEKEEKEKKASLKVDWKAKLPGLTDQEVQIYEYFDEKWHEQGNRLKAGSVDPIIEYDGKDYTRGAFVIEAKKRIEQSK